MRHLLPLLLIFLMFPPLPAAAQVNCTLFEALERIQFAQSRLAQSRAPTARSDDGALLTNELVRLDVAQLQIAHNGQLSQNDEVFLTDYVTKAKQLDAHLIAQRDGAVAAYFASPAFAPRQAQIARLLPRLGCNAQAGAGNQSGTARAITPAKQDVPARTITFTGSVVFLASITFLAALAHRIYVIAIAVRNRRRRRSKRFHTHIETQLDANGTFRKGTILDLSCNGAKIQIDTDSTDQTNNSIDLWIINHWHHAEISWLNTHYMGLKFTKPLRSAFVETICHPRGGA